MSEICAKAFLEEHLCALQVFLCAQVSRPVCVCTRAELIGKIAHSSLLFPCERGFTYSVCKKQDDFKRMHYAA